MMWEILGWVSAAWLILIVSALGVALLVAIIRSITKPAQRLTFDPDHVIFKSPPE